MPFPGIKVGDIGAKFGYDTMDNGYLAFDHYRVPSDALLKRFVNIDKEGNFELTGDPRAIYQIMVMTRVMIIFGSATTLLKQCRIATRYAFCRR
jgi:acyl-CoA oxidase